MTERKRWPDHAENMRMDAIALLLDIIEASQAQVRLLQVQLEDANLAHDRREVARLNLEIAKVHDAIAAKSSKAVGLLQEAKRS